MAAIFRRWLWLLPAAALPWLPIDERTGMDPAWCAHVEGNLAFMEGDHVQAEALYRRAVELDPDDWSAHSWLARTLARRGEREEAIAHVGIILKDFPDSYPTLKHMAHLQEKQGNIRQAAEFMVRAYEVPGKRSAVGAKAVDLLFRSGGEERARQIIDADIQVARRWAARKKR